jgi:hypothetical protein
MKYLLLLLTLLTLNYSTVNATALFPVKPLQEKMEVKESKSSKFKKRIPKKNHKKSENTVLSAVFWYGFMPLSIIALITLSFVIPGLGWLWFAGLGLFGIWAGVNGVVFFPLQFAGLPLGMALVIYGIIIKSMFLLTFGMALVFAALFAFSFMVLMFTIGTRKNQPK